MKKLIVFFLIGILFISCEETKKNKDIAEANSEMSTYYLIRHAEKNRASATPDDPELNEAGIARAERWTHYFDTIPLDQVYSTNYRRTRQTAKPIADLKELPIRSYDPRNLYDVTFQKETKGKIVLIVGHSNTTPAFVNTIIEANTYSSIDDNENGMLYRVVVSDTEPQITITKID